MYMKKKIIVVTFCSSFISSCVPPTRAPSPTREPSDKTIFATCPQPVETHSSGRHIMF